MISLHKRKKLYSNMLRNLIQNSMDYNNSDADCHDILRYKDYIKRQLISSSDVLYALHNAELEKESDDITTVASKYLDNNIYDYLRVPDSTDIGKSFILFDIAEVKNSDNNIAHITKGVTFRTLSHAEDISTDFDVKRHDLLALLVSRMFDGLQVFGARWVKVSDKPAVINNGYYYRELQFQIITSSSIVNKQRNGRVRI